MGCTSVRRFRAPLPLLAGAAALACTTIASCQASAQAPTPKVRSACFDSYDSAQRLRNRSKLVEARAQLLTCGAQDCPALLQKDCVKWLDELESQIPTVVFVARSGPDELADIRVHVDGTPAISRIDGRPFQVNPGEHDFRFEHPSGAVVSARALIHSGDRDRRILADFPQHTPARMSRWVWILGGVGLAATTASAVFGIRVRMSRADLERCKGHCAQEDVDIMRRDVVLTDVFLGVGVAALGGATYLYLTRPSQTSPKPPRVQLGLSATAGGPYGTFGYSF